MKTIINKKGNTGFIVGSWNFDSNGQLDCKDDLEFLVYMIKEVKVYSCGKKRMTLEILDSPERYNGFARDFFTPEFKIYESKEYAENAIIEEFKIIKTTIIERLSDHINVTIKAYSHFEWCESKVRLMRETIKRIETGEIKLKMITNSDVNKYKY